MTNHCTLLRKGSCLTSGYLVILKWWLPFLALGPFPTEYDLNDPGEDPVVA